MDYDGLDGPAVERLLVQLTTAGDGGVDALRQLVWRPRVVVRLEQLLRRDRTYEVERQRPARNPLGGPLDAVLDSGHPNGRIRARAVAAMLAEPRPEYLPWLVLRCADWAPQVREPARAGLTALVAGDPERCLRPALPMAMSAAGRERGRFVLGQCLAAVFGAGDRLRRELRESSRVEERRIAFDADLAQQRLRPADLTAIALRERDARIRHRAAEAACRDAVWTGDLRAVRRLLGSRAGDVRALAATALLRMGSAAEAAELLADPSSLVRATARFAAGRAGVDALAWYRAAVASAEPRPGAIAGLAEAGTDADDAALARLLGHAGDRVRASAVAALAVRRAVPKDLVLPLLFDPAPAVVREVTTALRPLREGLPMELPWRLMGDARVHVRRAGYRLVSGKDRESRLRAALLLAGDADAELARRARADVLVLDRRPVAG